jgi:hypothetical protein
VYEPIYSSGATGTISVGLNSAFGADGLASRAEGAGAACGGAAPVDPVTETSLLLAVADRFATGAGMDLPGACFASGTTAAAPDTAGGVAAALL